MANESTPRLSEPRVEERGARPYLAIGARTRLNHLAEVLPPLFPEVFGWLAARGITPDGAPFVRYLTAAMLGALDVEVGVPLANAHDGDGRVHPGTIQGGRYAVLVQTGPPDQVVVGHAALQEWGATQGLTWKLDGDQWGGRYEFALLSPDEQPDMNLWETEIAYLIA